MKFIRFSVGLYIGNILPGPNVSVYQSFTRNDESCIVGAPPMNDATEAATIDFIGAVPADFMIMR